MRPAEKVKGKAKKISFGGLVLFCKVLPFSSAIFALPNWNAFLKYSGLGGLGLFAEGTGPGQAGKAEGRALHHPGGPPVRPAPRGEPPRQRERAGQRHRWREEHGRQEAGDLPGHLSTLMTPTPGFLNPPAHSIGPLGCLIDFSNLVCPHT